MTTFLNNGMVHLNSSHPVEETLERLKTAIAGKGIHIHAVVDHSGDAAAAGLEMRPTKLVIFGAARAGTPLMVAAPTLAIDLPLKVLVWEDSEGLVWVSYNSPAYLQRRHAFPEELVKNIAAVKALAEEAVKEGAE